MSAVAQSCPLLTYANLNYTSATPVALSSLLSSCPELEVLKIAAVPKIVSLHLAGKRLMTETDDRHMLSSLAWWG